MNSSQFMDKQIMGLSGSQGSGEFFDMMNPQEENHHNNGGGVLKKEEILPSYDFQPLRTVGSSSSPVNSSGPDATRHSWGSADSKAGLSNLTSPMQYSNILETHELAKVSHEKERDTYDVATVAEIDRTVKKYADNLLHTLEGVSSRLSQLESRTRRLESSVDELKVSIGNNSGSTDGKLRQLESILREVQTGVQVLRDKKEIAEAQLQLTKLQVSSKGDHQHQPPEISNPIIGQPNSQQQQPLPPAPPNAPPPPPPPPPPSQQQTPPYVQFPASQSPQPQPQHYQAQYSQSLPHHPEESAPYMPPPPQAYPPSIRQPAPSTQPPTGGPPPPPQYYGQLTFPSGYGPSSGPSFSDPYPYSGSPSPFSSSPPSSGGGNNYSRLPTAKILPQAGPAGPSSGGAGGSRLPIDDVVDKVATMGFSRDQVRAAVRKLTESGQPVDLNVVLDKLMNDGEVIQPQKGWFGR